MGLINNIHRTTFHLIRDWTYLYNKVRICNVKQCKLMVKFLLYHLLMLLLIKETGCRGKPLANGLLSHRWLKALCRLPKKAPSPHAMGNRWRTWGRTNQHNWRVISQRFLHLLRNYPWWRNKTLADLRIHLCKFLLRQPHVLLNKMWFHQIPLEMLKGWGMRGMNCRVFFLLKLHFAKTKFIAVYTPQGCI